MMMVRPRMWCSREFVEADHHFSATSDSGSGSQQVPFDPTIVMVPLIRDERGPNSKHAF